LQTNVLPQFLLKSCLSLSVSLAASKAGAAATGVPLWKHYANLAGNPNPNVLPVPCFNVINGGEHAGNKLAFQEFFVIPTGAETFRCVKTQETIISNPQLKYFLAQNTLWLTITSACYTINYFFQCPVNPCKLVVKSFTT
jgi:enolase